MKTYSNEDYETPLEEIPGILGYSWDGVLIAFAQQVEILNELKNNEYPDMIEGANASRKISVGFKSGHKEIEFEAYTDVALIVNQVPSIDVQYDGGPPDAGPASGSGYLFFLKDGFSLEDVGFDLYALREAIDRDIQYLKSTTSL